MLIAERTLWLVLGVLALAIGYAVFNGVRWVEFQQSTIAAASDEQARRYADLKQQVVDIDAGRKRAPFADPRMPDMVGGRLGWTYAVMPPLPLAPLSVGQSDVLPSYLRVSTASRESMLTANEIENPHRLLHGRFDLSFVIVFILPLLVIALGYNLISLEREDGTLALVLSQPVALWTLVTAKVGFRAVLVVVVAVGFSLLGIAITLASPLTNDIVARLMLWVAAVIGYGLFWFGAVLLVTSLARSSATNAMALASIWLLLVVALPSTLNLAVSVLYPVPSRVDMIAAVRVATTDASVEGTQLLARYYGDHPELVATTDAAKVQNDVAITQLAIDEEIERRVRPVVERYDRQLARQQRVVDRLRFLSPAIVAQDALNDVAGTGAARYRHFVALVEDYHQNWRTLIASMLVRKQKVAATTYDELPQFAYREESLQSVVTRAGLGVGMLLIVGTLLAAIGIRRLTLPWQV